MSFPNARTYIVPLSRISSFAPSLVGNKALRLGQILDLNYDVPPGFCLTTLVFEEFLHHNRVRSTIWDQLQQATNAKISDIEEISRKIAVLVQSSEFPEEIIKHIEYAYSTIRKTGLSEPAPVAVRSSGTAEDLAGASFAGQYKSILFVSGINNILEAVKKCWASLWTARAIFYRRAIGIEENKASMAIIVQLAIDPLASGIAFTVDPVTGKDNIVINSTLGLGAKVVSGEYNADVFVVSRTERQIVERDIVDKQFMLKPDSSGMGTREVHVLNDLICKPSLDAEQIDTLVQAALNLEQYFSAPQDIEWAFSDDRLWLLQARPITAALDPFPIKWERESDRAVVWLRGAGITERLVDPVTPLSYSLFRRMVKTGWDAAMHKLPLPMVKGEAELRLFNHYLFWNIDLSAKPKPAKLVPFFFKFLFALTRGVDLWKKRLSKYLPAVQTLQDFQFHSADLSQLRDHLDAVCDLFADSFIWEVYLGSTVGIFGDIFLKLVPRLTGCTSRDATILTQGLGNITLKMERQIWYLAESIKKSPELLEVFRKDIDEYTTEHLEQCDKGREWLARFQNFLDDYGHQSPKDDWFFPDWSQNPLLVLKLLQAKLRFSHQNFDAIIDQRAKERRSMVDSILNRLKWKPVRRVLFHLLLSMAQQWIPLKDDRQFYIKLTCHQLRLTLHEIGKRLSDLEVLTESDNIFFLSLGELYRTIDRLSSGKRVDLRKLTKKRYLDWHTSFELSPPPKIKGDLVKDFATEYSGNRRVLQGRPASPGVATGVARVIHTPGEFDSFLSGEILVTSATNPCWAPLLSYAKAAVTNYGGSLCHCALIAREIGIPAVVGTSFATRVIRTGSTVTVDGTRGIVFIE